MSIFTATAPIYTPPIPICTAPTTIYTATVPIYTPTATICILPITICTTTIPICIPPTSICTATIPICITPAPSRTLPNTICTAPESIYTSPDPIGLARALSQHPLAEIVPLLDRSASDVSQPATLTGRPIEWLPAPPNDRARISPRAQRQTCIGREHRVDRQFWPRAHRYPPPASHLRIAGECVYHLVSARSRGQDSSAEAPLSHT